MRLYHNGKGQWYGTQREAREANPQLYRSQHMKSSKWFECNNIDRVLRQQVGATDFMVEHVYGDKAGLLKFLNENEVTP
mgnify:FL=1|jgi:hypothetical protein